jgi:membrane-bound lytic murein transglycosylase D
MKIKNGKVSFILGISIVVILIACVSADSVKPINKDVDSSSEDTAQENELYNASKNDYQVYAPDVPLNAHFANELVPLNNLIVKEALDKELLSNAYWHSNSFMYIKRANRWFPIIEPILKKNNIPDDFKYLAVIESGLTNATSPSGAKGFWQFMPKTAKDYNLEISDDIEERYNLKMSTEAACIYLQRAYDKFGNWTLAAASYNMGKTGLLNQLKKQKVNNYYDLLLNAETARYVYRMIAVKYILKDPAKFGFIVREDQQYQTFKSIEITIDSSVTNWADFAISQNTNYKTLKRLNPWLISNKMDNPSGKEYRLKLPIPGTGLDIIAPTDNKFGNDE